LQNVDLVGLAMMVQNSIRWSCYEDQSTPEWKHTVEEGILGQGLKATRLREWWSEFEKFCEWVVLEFAEFDEDD
jgi:adenosine deaminase CECR1